VDRVLSRVQPGAIVLMHPTEPTLIALPVILDRLLADGWRVVPVGELLRAAVEPARREDPPAGESGPDGPKDPLSSTKAPAA